MRNRLKTAVLITTVFTLGLFSPACKEEKSNKAAKAPMIATFTVKPTKTVTRLYYKGTLNPIRSIPVISPAEGYVGKVFFKYGETVKKDQKLLTVRATRLADSYRQAVSDYLQKKAALETQTSTFAGDKELYKAGVMSKQDFDNARNTYATAVLNLSQSKINLQKILKQANIDFNVIEKIKLEDVKRVDAIMQRSFSNILIRSPAEGVVLIPVGSKSDSGESKSNMLSSGTTIKDLQPILTLGDPSGYEIQIQVSELKITEINPGLPAIITGDSFPGIELKGSVKQVAVQADPNKSGSSSGVSMFNVVVVVPNVPKEKRKDIRVGMSAKVEILIQRPAKILIPISAVYMKNNQPMVMILDPKTKLHKEVHVVTGETTVDQVVIVQGLKTGDQVILHPKASSNVKAH